MYRALRKRNKRQQNVTKCIHILLIFIVYRFQIHLPGQYLNFFWIRSAWFSIWSIIFVRWQVFFSNCIVVRQSTAIVQSSPAHFFDLKILKSLSSFNVDLVQSIQHEECFGNECVWRAWGEWLEKPHFIPSCHVPMVSSKRYQAFLERWLKEKPVPVQGTDHTNPCSRRLKNKFL